jgi:predicted O-methyltransferase YrrM
MNISAKVRKALAIPRLRWTLKTMHAQTPESIVDFVMSEPLITPFQVHSELLAFAKLVAEARPKTVLEIGTARGGTLCVLTRLATADATIISIDLPGGPFGGGYGRAREFVFRRFPRDCQTLHLIKADSHAPETRKRAVELLADKKLDLLFIDGDHTYEGVKYDFSAYSPLVGRDGIIALHDIVPHFNDESCQVERFWRELACGREIIADRSQGWAGIGVLQGEQCVNRILPGAAESSKQTWA